MAYTNSSEVPAAWLPYATVGNASLYLGDCLDWLADQPSNSIHGVVTDPPYGLVEYTPEQLRKLRQGKGGVWRLPPLSMATSDPQCPGSLRSAQPTLTAWGASLGRGLLC